MSAVVELAARVALAWMNKRPFSPEARERRKALRKQRREGGIMPDKVIVTLADGSQIERTEPLIPARTSTKVIGSGVVLGLPIIQGIQELHFGTPWLESFVHSALFVQIATLAAAYLVARFSKSPIAGQAF
jgi:hypothetical protein